MLALKADKPYEMYESLTKEDAAERPDFDNLPADLKAWYKAGM